MTATKGPSRTKIQRRVTLTPQKSEDHPKKPRISFFCAEPGKSLEKNGKAHKKARKTAKRKKQGKRKKAEIGRSGEFRYGETIRYGRSKALWKGLRNACFCRQKRQENGTESEQLRRQQNTTDSNAVLFLVRKGPLGRDVTGFYVWKSGQLHSAKVRERKISPKSFRPECTKPSHSQSLANFVANLHSQVLSAIRTKFS